MNRSILSHTWIAGLTIAGGLFFSSQACAQVLEPEDDGIVPRKDLHFMNTAPIPYPFLRQDDIMWSTRHWERIDVREKINHPLYYPVQPLPDRKSLFDVLVDAITVEGSIQEVFRDDRFTRPLTTEEVTQLVATNDTIRDPDDPSKILFIDELKIKAPDVVAWEIKSDWYFDKQRGEMKNRIIGISPVVKDLRNKSTTYNLFWIWFPDARQAMATHIAYNPTNNQQRLTFDQIFHKRMFSSIIYKEDNTYDREIADYKRNTAMDQLLESQRIHENLREYEHDLWEF
ncbi:type IX secretion system ring subunit PorN/GldN [Phaeocystidibacter marisrubri]|uniref:Gliding motility protein GldN n=1 Tax=Phaeocystidibacter marisrubri TaxID=1577780 RepID=A0A6L3ZGW0_9FLAO|nr:gliding motility protein GldN [Phaeocystidibacter marisrubri]KAB2816853.1 gliding motility protein GldN [Phaeocystidibacter marisrubri]GGH77873.1 gliding motility protein GldO [Phaeocystidibacter marisrubri]